MTVLFKVQGYFSRDELLQTVNQVFQGAIIYAGSYFWRIQSMVAQKTWQNKTTVHLKATRRQKGHRKGPGTAYPEGPISRDLLSSAKKSS